MVISKYLTNVFLKTVNHENFEILVRLPNYFLNVRVTKFFLTL